MIAEHTVNKILFLSGALSLIAAPSLFLVSNKDIISICGLCLCVYGATQIIFLRRWKGFPFDPLTLRSPFQRFLLRVIGACALGLGNLALLAGQNFLGGFIILATGWWILRSIAFRWQTRESELIREIVSAYLATRKLPNEKARLSTTYSLVLASWGIPQDRAVKQGAETDFKNLYQAVASLLFWWDMEHGTKHENRPEGLHGMLAQLQKNERREQLITRLLGHPAPDVIEELEEEKEEELALATSNLSTEERGKRLFKALGIYDDDDED